MELLDTSLAEQQVSDEKEANKYAEKIWNAGGAFGYICRSCGLFHAGDKRVTRIMILSFVSTYCLNSYGMHINVSGDAGTGKSHCATNVAGHLPVAKVIKGRMSDKAIFHHKFEPGCIYILDDQSPTEDFEEVIKESTTEFHEATIYRSVKNGAPVEHLIQPESLFWIVKAEQVGDEQTQDRMFNLHTDNSDEQLDAIKESIIEATIDPSKKADITSKLISRRIWTHVPRAYVSIPYARHIKNEERPDARNLNLFLDLIMTSALIHAPLRKRGEDINGMPNIIASIHDFTIAARLMNPLLNNIGGSQKNKIDKNGQKILDWLEENYPEIVSDPIPFSTIRDALGFKPPVMTRATNGRDDRGTYKLDDRCPAVEIVTMNTHADNGTGTYTGKGIRWNPYVYKEWSGKGGLFVLDLPDDWERENPTRTELTELEEIKADDEEELARIEHEKEKQKHKK
ncbi:MAG TPA: hypothetical protein O0X50_00290 [Methanocorpusculum sp.]|nr:hypothetical protein [Methanocorpusculum sp.]